MPIFAKKVIYEKVSFSREEEFEKTVIDLADQIFGTRAIYLDVKKKLKGNNIGIIPDGFLLDLTIPDEPKLYIVENEIVNHDPFRHIGIQMLKFATSFDEGRIKLRNLIMKEITKSEIDLKRLEAGCNNSSSRNIDNYLDKAVYADFHGLVIIDEAKNELFKVLEKINSTISVLELKAYKSSDGDYAYEFDSLYPNIY